MLPGIKSALLAASTAVPLAFGASLGATSSGATISSLAHAVNAAVPAGSFVVVTASHKNDVAAPTCSDARGNTYQLAIAQLDGASRTVAIFYSVLTTALQLNDNVTVSWGASSADGNVTQVYYCTGAFLGTVRTGGAVTSGSPSVTVTNALGVVFGIGTVNNNGESFSPPAGWTEDLDVNAIGASTTTNHRNTNATATVTWSPTESGSSSGAFAAASFL